MKLFEKEKQLCFDDILMVPQNSEIKSRSDIDLTMHIGSGKGTRVLNTPIIASPMDTVCESDMAIAIAELGGIGIIHRFMPVEKQISMVSNVSDLGLMVGAAVGARNKYLEDAKSLVIAGASVILVDTANGHSEYTVNAVRELRKLLGYGVHIMAGNVSTYEGFAKLADASADSIRVGIGGGSVCTTRIMTGHGIPTLASIMSIKSKVKDTNHPAIIADGGIKTSGDAVKAFAAGASAVMLGARLAGTDESPGDVYINETGKFKTFRGMASKEVQEETFGRVSVAEGVSTMVKYTGTVADVVNEFRGGIASGCSYTGVSKLSDLCEESMYVEVTPLSIKESKPHAHK